MTIQKTLWSPDTCGCQLEYSWDDTVPQDQRTHSISKIIKSCPIHINLPDKESHYAEILAENQSKNKAIGLMVSTIKILEGTEDQITWRFELDRSIVISHPLLTQADKDVLNALDKSIIVKGVKYE